MAYFVVKSVVWLCGILRAVCFDLLCRRIHYGELFGGTLKKIYVYFVVS